MKRVLVAAVVAAALLGLYFGLRTLEQRDREAQQQAKQLVQVDLDRAFRVELTRRDTEPERIVLAKEDGRWELVEPVRYRASQGAVDSLLQQMGSLTYERSFTAQGSLAQFDLEPPRFAATWHTGDGTETTQVGGETPVGDNVYARQGADGARVAVVSSSFQRHLKKGVDDWRTKDLIWEFPAEVAAVRFETQEAAWEVTSASGTWYGDGTSLATEKVEGLLSRVENMSVREFVSAKPEEDRNGYGLLPPRRTLTLTGADGRTVKLAFGRPFEDKNTVPVYYEPRGVIVSVSDFVYENLWKRPDEQAPEPATASSATTGPNADRVPGAKPKMKGAMKQQMKQQMKRKIKRQMKDETKGQMTPKADDSGGGAQRPGGY